MKQAANCKMCGKPIVLTIDDDYAKLGDIHKLIPMATCNRCYDLGVRRQNIEDAIKKVCYMLIQSPLNPTTRAGKPNPEVEAVERTLTRLTQDYAHLVSDWHNKSGILWEKEFVNLLMEKPRQWGDILNGYWKMFRETPKPPQRQPEMQEV